MINQHALGILLFHVSIKQAEKVESELFPVLCCFCSVVNDTGVFELFSKLVSPSAVRFDARKWRVAKHVGLTGSFRRFLLRYTFLVLPQNAPDAVL